MSEKTIIKLMLLRVAAIVCTIFSFLLYVVYCGYGMATNGELFMTYPPFSLIVIRTAASLLANLAGVLALVYALTVGPVGEEILFNKGEDVE